MKPTQPQEIYKKTAKRLNLPEEYVKDVVEYFYQTTKDSMGTLSYTIFCLAGLGRFLIRPFKFYNKQERIKKLVERFQDRRDNRGIMIRKALEFRYQQFEAAKEKVDIYNQYKRKRMFKNERDSKNKSSLEK